MKPCLIWVLGGLLVSLTACGDDSSSSDGAMADGTDTESSDGSATDEGGTEAAGSDGASTDASETGATATDAAGTDAAETDAAGTDAAETDAAGTDSPLPDAGGTDSVVLMDDEGASVEIVFSEEGTDCGAELCQDARIEGLPIGVRGCCFDEEAEICGFDMSTLGLALNLSDPGCEQLEKPGSSDPSCPESEPVPIVIPGAPPEVVMPGCCQENGQCGFAADFGDFGFGCVDPERFSQDSTGECDYQP